MVFRVGYRSGPKKHERECSCGHPHLCHYTKDGACVYQACDCKAFKAKGRPEFQQKRGTCHYGHSHDSGLEIKSCFDFHIRKEAGEIRSFKFHPVIELPGPSGAIVAKYEVDFVLEYPDGVIEFIECKGKHLVREMGWRIKWALLQDKHAGDQRYKFQVITG